MTAQASANKVKSNFLTNFNQKIKNNRRISIVIFILHMLAAPLNLAYGLIYMFVRDEAIANHGEYAGYNELYTIIGIFATGLAVLAGVLVAINVFQYLYKKSRVDMYYSLPLTTNQRFFSDFLAGLTVYAVPFLAASVFTVILGLVCQFCFPLEFAAGGRIGGVPGSVSSLVGLLLLMILAGIVLMLMVYTLTVLTMTCCGSLFEVLSYTVGLNVMLPATPAVFAYVLFDPLYGISAGDEALPFILRTSPIGGAIGLIDWLSGDGKILEFLSLVLPMFVVAGVTMLISWLLYRKRKAEHTGRPFVFKGFYFVLITCLTFCIACLFVGGMNFESSRIVPMIIVSAVVYLILELITNRGFKKFWKCLAHYGITIASVLVLMAVSSVTGGFGVVNYIPLTSSVESVAFCIPSEELYWSKHDWNFKETDNINLVREIHAEILANNNGDNYYDVKSTEAADNNGIVNLKYSNVEIRYKLKNGSTVSRYYYCPTVSYETFLKAADLSVSDENINNVIDYNKKCFDGVLQLRDRYGVYSKTIWSNIFVTTNSYINTDIYEYNNIDSNNKKNKAKEYEKLTEPLFEALRTDLLSKDKSEFYKPTHTVKYILLCNSDKYAITENDINTLKWLNSYGIKESDIYGELKSPASEFIVRMERMSCIGDMSAHDTILFSNDYHYGYGSAYAFRTHYGEGLKDSTELLEMLKHIQPYYISDQPEWWSIDMTNMSFYIPDEYKSAADKLYDSAPLWRGEDGNDHALYE